MDEFLPLLVHGGCDSHRELNLGCPNNYSKRRKQDQLTLYNTCMQYTHTSSIPTAQTTQKTQPLTRNSKQNKKQLTRQGTANKNKQNTHNFASFSAHGGTFYTHHIVTHTLTRHSKQNKNKLQHEKKSVHFLLMEKRFFGFL